MSRDYEGMQSFQTAIGRGEIEWATPISAYGRISTGGAVTNRVIWPDGVYNIPDTAGVQISIVSTSANDTSGGTGIQTMEIHYLDANLMPQMEEFTLNGTTPVLTVATDIRFIQCIHIKTAGSLKSSAGVITFSNSAIVYAQMEAGSRRCSSSARMVPAGKKLYVSGAVGGSISGTAAAQTQIKISSTYFDGHDLTDQLIPIPFGSIGVQDNTVGYTFQIPAGPFPEGTIVLMETTTDKAATVTGNWFGWLENA